MNTELRLLLDRVERVTEELRRVKNAIIAVSEGRTFTEAFDEELYLEAADIRNKTIRYLSRMIEHLLKLAYSDSNIIYEENKNGWIKTVNKHQIRAQDELNWGMISNKGDINYVSNRIQEAYEGGIYFYKLAIKKKGYEDLIKGLDLIPDECPWTLEELMEDNINELFDKLPDKMREKL
jgi:hypothetical protein